MKTRQRPSFAGSVQTRRRMQAVRRRDTPPELAIRSVLYSRGLRYRVDYAPLASVRRKADIVFTKMRVAVFVDGCFWHACPEHATWPKVNAEWWRAKIEGNRRRDEDTDHKLSEAGWTVVRVWAHEESLLAVERILTAVRACGRQVKRWEER